MSSSTKPAYVSSSGSLGERPLAVRISDTVADAGSLAYLFFETLLSPILNPASWTNPSATGSSVTRGRNDGNSGSGRSLGGGGGGGGGSGGGGGGRGGGGGFMSMGDLRGGGTVDGCRSTCG
ncbi:uncharacterized protein MKK02DRAFT_44794 [Dioszegia hungarica]|uniref:Uncharacterized protein n=1 Tax=Dioszegia hungarica TaxID=4972 RepID=A0AA38H8T1_9TREE|nr:uncharacterized protein MKK02DRAFT_44794 [Dioszegia hungarica]KAI9636093.1 hypothetical protein MKK02DRAFT_44794 [Dioszegia hungarica]